MADITSKIIKLETPASESDPNYEEFEFMLAWYSRTGSYMNYLFTDWRLTQNVRATALNIQTESKLQNIISSEERTVRLTAEDLTLNDLNIIRSITVAKKIIRVYKDGSKERIGLSGNSKTSRQTDGRYNFEFNVELYELALAK